MVGHQRHGDACKRIDINLGIYVFALAVYLSVTIPTLRTIVTPLELDTRSDRIEALRVLSAGNVIIGLCLGGILLMQVSGHPKIACLLTVLKHLMLTRPARSTHGARRWLKSVQRKRRTRVGRVHTHGMYHRRPTIMISLQEDNDLRDSEGKTVRERGKSLCQTTSEAQGEYRCTRLGLLLTVPVPLIVEARG